MRMAQLRFHKLKPLMGPVSSWSSRGSSLALFFTSSKVPTATAKGMQQIAPKNKQTMALRILELTKRARQHADGAIIKQMKIPVMQITKTKPPISQTFRPENEMFERASLNGLKSASSVSSTSGGIKAERLRGKLWHCTSSWKPRQNSSVPIERFLGMSFSIVPDTTVAAAPSALLALLTALEIAVAMLFTSLFTSV